MTFVRNALQMGLTDEEASLMFTKLIESSLSSRATKLNFFIHNIAQAAQRKASVSSSSSGAAGSSLLTFAPTVATLASDGRIMDASVIGFEKRYDAEQSKYYVYTLQVQREDGTTSLVFRRFSELNEFHQKLTAISRLELPSFPSKIYVGRSHTRAVSEKRQKALHKYLQDLLAMPASVSECDLLYTFLHTLQRDVHDNSANRGDAAAPGGADEVASFALDDAEDLQRLTDFMSVHDKTGELSRTTRAVSGEVNVAVKLVDTTLYVSVLHARHLPPNDAGTANTYCAIFMLPERSRDSKRKTTIKTETLNPTWNETLVYSNMSATELSARALAVCVYERDFFSDKVILKGGKKRKKKRKKERKKARVQEKVLALTQNSQALVGEATVDLAGLDLKAGVPAWYKLSKA